jgi:putative redox protein
MKAIGRPERNAKNQAEYYTPPEWVREKRQRVRESSPTREATPDEDRDMRLPAHGDSPARNWEELSTLMELTIKYLGGHRFETIAHGHRLVSDQPLENGGTDIAVTPPELFLFSLATCAGYYAAEYLNVRALPSEDLEVRVSGVKGDRPPRFISINLEVAAPGLNKRHRDGILRAVESCLISNTLIHPPTLDVKVASSRVPEPVGA